MKTVIFYIVLSVWSASSVCYANDDTNLQQRVSALEAELAKLKAKPVLTKVDGGLRAQTADGSSKFRFAGRVQADYLLIGIIKWRLILQREEAYVLPRAM